MAKNKEEPLIAKAIGTMLDTKLDSIYKSMMLSLDKKLEPLKNLDTLKSDIDSLKSVVSKQEERADGFDKYTRLNNIVVYGVPQEPGRVEYPLEKALEIIKAVGVDLELKRHRYCSPPQVTSK